MSSFLSETISNPRFQLLATAAASGAVVAGLIFGFQALEREERLSELKNSIPSLSNDYGRSGRVNEVFQFYRMHSKSNLIYS